MPSPIRRASRPDGRRAASYPVTQDGRVILVPTPGHIPGHVSVIVRDTDITYFIAGDATYKEANIRDDLADGVTSDPELSLKTLKNIKAFALNEPTIVLPSHDPDGPTRLKVRKVFAEAFCEPSIASQVGTDGAGAELEHAGLLRG
jgi:N-acyl homoserine lactone hydrolase